MTTTITLRPLVHSGMDQIAIEFPYDTEVKNHIKALGGVNWSQTHKTFYISNTGQNKSRLYQHLRDKKWYVDYSALKKVPEPIHKKEKTISNTVVA